MKNNELLQFAEVQLTYKSQPAASERPRITNSQDVQNIFRQVYEADRIEHVEFFYLMLLNRANRVIGVSLIGQGGISATVADIRVIFQTALKANASSIIVSHNHPSGAMNPSAEDVKLTKRIAEAGKLLEIPLLDHVILTSENYYSFADNGEL
jgi:DNA repair protein RadC